MRLICVGTKSNISQSRFTGQSVMFDGIVDAFLQNGNMVTVIDIASRFKNNITVFRCLDYAIVLLKLLFYLTFFKYEICYITTSQSRNGFARDYAIISLCKLFRVPVISHQYGANYHQLLDALSNRGIRRLKKMFGYVSTIIVEGEYMKEQFSFLPNFQTKVNVIPNGLPVEGKHAQIAKIFDDTKWPFVMFYLSNLIWSKGYFDVLRAVDILVNKEHLNVKCVFAGRFMASHDDERSGISNKGDFDSFIKEHRLTDRVEYYQGLYGDEKDDFFYRSNVFLLPTYYINEGQPVSIVEAMAYGCVPIVTEYRHIPMMVNEINGCYVKPRCPEDIAKQVKFLVMHPNVYASKSMQSIADYQQKFKFEVYANRVIECINAVIS